MKNFIQEGRMLTATAPAGGVTSGQGVIIGAMFGVAAIDAAQGKDFEMAVEGVFALPKAAGVIAEKVKVYWITADKKVTTTATSNTLIGHAAKAAADGDTTVEVRISN